MGKNFFIFLCVSVLLASVAFAQLPYYEVHGYVTSDEVAVEGATVAFYLDFSQRITAETDPAGYFELNAFELDYYFDVPITFETQSYTLAVLDHNGWGTEEAINLSILYGYTEEALALVAGGYPEEQGGNIAGTVTDASGTPIAGAIVTVEGESYFASSDASGNYSIMYVPVGSYSVACSKDGYQTSVVDPVTVTLGETVTLDFELTESIDGPELTLTVLLQGFYSGGEQVETTISVEARTVPMGEPDDVAENATEVVGSTIITLNQDNNTTGTNGFGDLFTPGYYYLVITHYKDGVPIHLPIISTDKQIIPGTYDFSATEMAYTPVGYQDAMLESEGLYYLWVGDAGGNGKITDGDYTIWVEAWNNYRDDAADYNAVADFNGNGRIEDGDYTLWVYSWSRLREQTESHSYVP